MMVDRRRFLAGAGMAGVAGGLGFSGWASRRRVAYAVGDQDRVCVFEEGWGGWRLSQTVHSRAAAGVAVSADGRMVYVGNAVDGFEGRPSGAVEAFSVAGDGRLGAVGQVGLGLFGHGPERLAVSPHGRWLAVGLAGGGYNLLALRKDGLPGRVVSALRRIGGMGGGGELVFAEDGLLVNFFEGEAEVLTVGADGALACFDGVRGTSALRGGGLDVGLVRAMAVVGVEGRAVVAS